VLSLSPSTRDLHPADERLCRWLDDKGVKGKTAVPIQLQGNDLNAALRCLPDHPELRLQGGKEFFIRQNYRVPVRDEAPDGQARVRLKRLEESEDWLVVGDVFWFADEQGLHGLADMPSELSLRGRLETLLRSGAMELDARDLLDKLDAWQAVLDFSDDGWLGTLHFVNAEPLFSLRLDGSADELIATLDVDYGDGQTTACAGKVGSLPRLRGGICEVRNQVAETAAVTGLMRVGFVARDRDLVLHGRGAVAGFLAGGVAGLPGEWAVGFSQRLNSLRDRIELVSPVIEEEGGSFRLVYRTNGGELVSADEVRRILRGGKREGRQWVVAREAEEMVEPLLADLDLHQGDGALHADERSAEVLRELRARLSGASGPQNHDPAFPPPATLNASMRGYQTSGAGWLQDRCKRFGGALLADDMGLGKTLQTIAVIEALFAQEITGPVLIVATASLLGNWRAEFAKFAPSRTVRILHGSARDKEQAIVRPGDVVLTSYGTLARDLAWHLRQAYQVVVADEASLMRNPDTDHAKAMAKLNARARIALTGTPLENGVRDLWSIFRFIQPGWLGGRNEFRDRYETPLSDEAAAAAALRRLRLKTSPFILRRTKDQVAPELPSKLVIDEFCDLSQDQRTVYRKLADEGRRRADDLDGSGAQGAARMQALTTLLRLRQACCDLALLGNETLAGLPLPRRSAKMERLFELLDEALSGVHRVLVFSQFKAQLDAVSALLAERGTAHLQLDGGTRNRQELVDRFQSPDGPPVFLISLKAGGYGLNLTAADVVIHLDPWWNPAAEAQATDRAHRIGQTKPVTVYRLLTRDTVEHHVLQLQSGKRQLAEAIDERGETDVSGLNDAALRALVRDA
jgi:superfamily II DNA or RNA helicase